LQGKVTAAESLVSQRLDGIHLSGSHGWVEAEENADNHGNSKGNRD
jgi:hypothetical protein